MPYTIIIFRSEHPKELDDCPDIAIVPRIFSKKDAILQYVRTSPLRSQIMFVSEACSDNVISSLKNKFKFEEKAIQSIDEILNTIKNIDFVLNCLERVKFKYNEKLLIIDHTQKTLHIFTIFKGERKMRILIFTGPIAELSVEDEYLKIPKAGRSTIVKELCGFLLKNKKSIFLVDLDYPRLINELLLYKPREEELVKSPLTSLLLGLIKKLKDEGLSFSEILNRIEKEYFDQIFNDSIIPGRAFFIFTEDVLRTLGLRSFVEIDRQFVALRVFPAISLIYETFLTHYKFIREMDLRKLLKHILIKLIDRVANEGFEYVLFDTMGDPNALALLRDLINQLQMKYEVYVIFILPYIEREDILDTLNSLAFYSKVQIAGERFNITKGYLIIRGSFTHPSPDDNAIKDFVTKLSMQRDIKDILNIIIGDFWEKERNILVLPWIPGQIWDAYIISFYSAMDGNLFKDVFEELIK